MVWFLWFVGLPLAAGTWSLETIASFGCVLAAGGGCTSCASIFWPIEVTWKNYYINKISKSRYIGLDFDINSSSKLIMPSIDLAH